MCSRRPRRISASCIDRSGSDAGAISSQRLKAKVPGALAYGTQHPNLEEEVEMRRFAGLHIIAVGCLVSLSALAAGDLTQQASIEVHVDLGAKGEHTHAFHPNNFTFETGKLYKLVIHNPSPDPHYFSSPGLAARVFTRKIQVMDKLGGDAKPVGEIKGLIREVEVYPGGTAEWFFVPVAAGTVEDLHCPVKAEDGKTHTQHGMVGTITIQ
jgi:uncharacterized cupredoxin-like copper-binding protein